MNLTGTWKGYYEYGFGYDPPYFGNKVDFTMILNDIDCSLTGNTYEVKSDLSVDSEAEINGFYENDFISFVKTYPFFPTTLDDTIDNSITDKKLVIEHTGNIDFSSKIIYGKWTIEDTVSINGEVLEMVNEGIFFLKKTN